MGHRRFRFPVGGLAALLLQACAVEVYDPGTDTTHLWGFGHLSVSKHTAEDGTTAVVTGVESYGLTLANRADETALNLGMRRNTRTEILSHDAELALEWNGNGPHALRARRSWLPPNATLSQEAPPP